jgi:hypothetical protein
MNKLTIEELYEIRDRFKNFASTESGLVFKGPIKEFRLKDNYLEIQCEYIDGTDGVESFRLENDTVGISKDYSTIYQLSHSEVEIPVMYIGTFYLS